MSRSNSARARSRAGSMTIVSMLFETTLVPAGCTSPPRWRSGQDLDDHAERESLVPAERQDRARGRGVEGLGIGGRVAVPVEQDRPLGPASPCWPRPGSSPRRWCRWRGRRGSAARPGPARPRRSGRPTACARCPREAPRGCPRRWCSRSASRPFLARRPSRPSRRSGPGAPHSAAPPARAELRALVEGQPHGLLAHDLAEPEAAVEHRHHLVLADDLEGLVGDQSCPARTHSTYRETRTAPCESCPDQVGLDQVVGDPLGLVVVAAGGGKMSCISFLSAAWSIVHGYPAPVGSVPASKLRGRASLHCRRSPGATPAPGRHYP